MTGLLPRLQRTAGNTARRNLGGSLPTLKTKTADAQAQALTKLITSEGAIPDVVAETVTTPAVEYTLEGPTERKDFAFSGRTADAEEWIAKFKDGVDIPIVAPKGPTPGLHNHTVQQKVRWPMKPGSIFSQSRGRQRRQVTVS